MSDESVGAVGNQLVIFACCMCRADVFTNAGINLDEPVVTTCGSGVTAAALSLALETMGHENHLLYDGSWAEWGGRDDTEVVKKD